MTSFNLPTKQINEIVSLADKKEITDTASCGMLLDACAVVPVQTSTFKDGVLKTQIFHHEYICKNAHIPLISCIFACSENKLLKYLIFKKYL